MTKFAYFILISAIASIALTTTALASPDFIAVRSAADANGATVAWDAGRGAVVITRADNSNYVLVVGEDGSFNYNGTIFAPAALIQQIFATGYNIHGGLHRIEHAGSVAYLFGSLHGGLDDWFPLADIVEDAMRRADVFAFEIDFALDEAEVAALVEALRLLPYGQTITDILCKELYTHYIAMMTNWSRVFPGILENIYYVNPAFLILSLQQALMSIVSDIDIQGDGGITVDGYVMDFALQNQRPVIGLMDFEAQQRVLFTPPQEILLYMVAGLDIFENTYREMRGTGLGRQVYYYVINNSAGLVRELHADFNPDEETGLDRYIRYVVLNSRSVLFAEELARHMEEAEEPTVFFVTIGKSHLVRHLAGPYFTSTIQQLELMGIEAVPQF